MRRYEISLKFTLVSEGPAVCLDNPAAVHAYLAPFYEVNPLQEQFYVICLNQRHFPTGAHRVTQGTLTSTLCAPREVFRTAILDSAAAIIVGHNHPSGDPSPSSADTQMTRILREAGKVVGIELLDHVICGSVCSDPLGRGFFSFRDSGLI